MNVALPLEGAENSFLLSPAGTSWTELPTGEQLLLWSMRHMIVCWPSCSSVRSALHGAYGDDAVGVEHLLRCLLTGIGVWSTRLVSIGDPTCAPILNDEAAILDTLRTCRRDPAAARAALIELCAEPRAGSLLPLAVSLADAAGLNRRA